MPEFITAGPVNSSVRTRLQQGAHAGWGVIRDFYRIRPIPGSESIKRPEGRKAISFNELFKELWIDWRVLITGVIAGILVSFFVVLTSEPSYQAVLPIAPAQSGFNGAESGSAGQGVLSMFALKPSDLFDDFAQFLGLVHSVRLAKRLDEKYGLMKQVFPYDEKRHQYVPASGLMPWLSRTVREMLGLPGWQPPNYLDLADYLTGAVEIARNGDGTGLLIHYDSSPQAAYQFLNRVYTEAGELMREEELNSHRNRRKYVAQRLNDTATLEQRNFLMSLWGREESQILVLTSGDPVGARKIDDMHVPNMPQTGAAKKLALGVLLGLLAGLVAIVIRSTFGRA